MLDNGTVSVARAQHSVSSKSIIYVSWLFLTVLFVIWGYCQNWHLCVVDGLLAGVVQAMCLWVWLPVWISLSPSISPSVGQRVQTNPLYWHPSSHPTVGLSLSHYLSLHPLFLPLALSFFSGASYVRYLTKPNRFFSVLQREKNRLFFLLNFFSI